MKLIINKDRSVIQVGTWGTKNENDFEIVDFEFPEELEGYNKRIVYLLGGGDNPWGIIRENKAYITSEITSKENVKGYVWCTKGNPNRPADTDFRSQEFDIPFYENEQPTGVVPTPQQVDGFNEMLTEMNAKIDEADALEQTIGAAESTRQTNETTRQTNEQTRQDNEATRQENEQTRQTQEADRERRTDEAIADIQDKTAEYNANAEAKTTAFNNNATQKTNDFNSNYTQKVNDFNTNASSKETAFNSNASSKTTAFNENATSKTNTFNSNASSKTTDFNTNAENKTSVFNTNASDKTTAFDNNASSKTSDFNTNAESKTNTFNDNATQKTTDFNNNAQAKTEAFDEHTSEITADIEELQQEVDELSENMPWDTTEQATEIQVTDAAKYSKNKMKVFGNTEQTQYSGYNLFDLASTGHGYGTVTGGVFTSNAQTSSTFANVARLASTPDISLQVDDVVYISFDLRLVSGTCTRLQTAKLQNNSNTVISKTETGVTNPDITNQFQRYVFSVIATGTDCKKIYVQSRTADNAVFEIKNVMVSYTNAAYEPYVGGQPSPNPDYPQQIHVVSGENDIYWTSNENKLDLNKNYIKGGINSNTGAINTTANPIITLGNNSISVYTSSAWNGYISDYYDCQPKDIIQLNFVASTNYFWVAIAEYDLNKQYIKATPISNTSLREINIKTTNETKYLRLIFEGSRSGYSIDFTNINFVFQNHVILNLGSIELCKIGDYQDYLYKENGNWYKYRAINKLILTENANIFSVPYGVNSYGLYVPPNSFMQVINNKIMVISNKYKGIAYNDRTNEISNSIYEADRQDMIHFRNTQFETVEDFITNNIGTILYVVLKTPTITQITDETLISQLDAIYEHLQLVKGTNNISVTASDLAPYMELSYMQDLKSKLDNLDSRLSLLE